jgi:predicted nucleotidyltransferase
VGYVFGSRVSGRAWAESDLDIAVRWDRTLDAAALKRSTLALVGALTDALGELGERADIVDLDRAGSAVAFRAVRDGILVYETSKAERVRALVDVVRRYDDDAPNRALFRRAALDAAGRFGEERRGRS